MLKHEAAGDPKRNLYRCIMLPFGVTMVLASAAQTEVTCDNGNMSFLGALMSIERFKIREIT